MSLTADEKRLSAAFGNSPQTPHGGSRRGAGRPAKAKPPASPSSSSPTPGPTGEDWDMLVGMAGMCSLLLDDEIKKRAPNWPVSDKWRTWRQKSLEAVVRKHGNLAARHAVEANCLMAFGMSAWLARFPAGTEINVDLSAFAKRKPAPAPAPVAAETPVSEPSGSTLAENVESVSAQEKTVGA